ncbi:MAG: hypothetical protein N2510_01905 [Ignavibacteria bacterium]|nr:hypothetical protein [Ignavibacteria bacterium]
MNTFCIKKDEKPNVLVNNKIQKFTYLLTRSNYEYFIKRAWYLGEIVAFVCIRYYIFFNGRNGMDSMFIAEEIKKQNRFKNSTAAVIYGIF